MLSRWSISHCPAPRSRQVISPMLIASPPTPAPQAANATNSSDTYGLRLNGNTAMGGNKVLYTAEYAEQRSAHGNTVNYKTNYALLEAGVDLTNIAVFKLGYEVLGSDTGATGTATIKSFSTPLATLH